MNFSHNNRCVSFYLFSARIADVPQHENDKLRNLFIKSFFIDEKVQLRFLMDEIHIQVY